MIFGKKGCNEDRNWNVRIHFIDSSEIDVIEQVSEKEAKDFFNKIKKEFNNSKTSIELKINLHENKKEYLIPKRNIKCIKLFNY